VWIGRTNLVLVGGVLAVGASLLVGGLTSPPHVLGIPLLPLDASEPVPMRSGVPETRLEPFLKVLRRFHGQAAPERAARPTPPAEDSADGFALTTLAISAIIRSPNGKDLVLFRSKDPAHPISCQLCEGEEQHGIALVSLRYEGRVAHAKVRRGSCEGVLTFSLDRDLAISLIREVRAPESPAALVASGSPRRRWDAASIKCVPFFDDEGRRIGLRVTGVDPASGLREAGLSAGVVITALDGKSAPSRELLAVGLSGPRNSLQLMVRGATDSASRSLVVAAK
jgi:hypothetical protein